MLPAEVFGNLFRREFGFAYVAEISGKVNGFSCKKKERKKNKINLLWDGTSITQLMEMREFFFLPFTIQRNENNINSKFVYKFFYLFSIHQNYLVLSLCTSLILWIISNTLDILRKTSRKLIYC